MDSGARIISGPYFIKRFDMKEARLFVILITLLATYRHC